jgi:hypothetical protein
MASIKVRVLNKDNKYGGRNIDVTFGSSSFETPNRSATQKDYYAASSLPHNIIIKNPISEFVTSFDNPSLTAFLTGNGSFSRRHARIVTQSLDMMRYFPTISTIQLPANVEVTQDKLWFFDKVQIGPCNIISIPPFEYKDIAEYKAVITQYSDIAKSRGQEAMPILRLSNKLEIFKAEFAALRDLNNDIGLCKIIGFAYANPFNYPHQFYEIYRNREEAIWYHAFGVPRVPRGKKIIGVAHIHELQNWGLDTFSPEVRHISPKAVVYLIKKSQATKPEEVQCRRFDSATLGIFKEPDWIERYKQEIHCECPVCKDKDLHTFKETYTHELDGSFNPNLLRDADKTHELSSGSREFTTSRDAIKSDDLPKYYRGKEFTKGRVNPPEI